MYSNIHAEELPETDNRCQYKVGVATLCGYERVPGSDYCADHDKMQHGTPLVESKSLKTLAEYKQDMGNVVQLAKNERHDDEAANIRDTHGFTDPFDSVKKLRELATRVDPEGDLADMLEGHFTTMEWCSRMESHNVIQQYRMASSEIVKAIKERRIENGATDHISDMIKDLQEISEPESDDNE